MNKSNALPLRKLPRPGLPPSRSAGPFRLVWACAVLLSAAAGAQGSTATDPQAQQIAQNGLASTETVEIQRLIKDGQHSQALKLIDEALQKAPDNPQMQFRRGVVLSMLDRKSEALTVFQKLVAEHPEMPAPYNNLAVLHGSLGDYDKARADLESAIRTSPAYATAYQNLGDVYAQLASQAYGKALQLDKTDSSVQPKLALLRELTSGSGASSPGGTLAKRGVPTERTPAPSPVPVPAPAPPQAVVAARPAAPALLPPVIRSASLSASAAVDASAKPPSAAASAGPASKPLVVGVIEPKPAAAVASPVADVEAAVRAWAVAWSRRDLNAYYGAYTPDYAGQSGSRENWEKDRRDRIASRKQIRVEVADLKVTVQGDRATARFKQTYASDALSTRSR